MIVTSLPDHFAFELVGGRRTNRTLKVVPRKLENPRLYFGQFTYPAGMEPVISGVARISHLAIITSEAQEELKRRFPGIVDAYASKISYVGRNPGLTVEFPTGQQYFRVDDVLLGNALNGMVRIRHIRFAVVVTKDISSEEYRNYLRKQLPTEDRSGVVAVQLIPGNKAETTLRAAQFANIYLMNQLHETSIGSFIDLHREILLSALEAQQLISEPYLPWVVPSPDPNEHAINPDLFVKRADGYWDVYDLKLALLNHKKLTTGKRNRRRFMTTIEDGIAQLAHYRDFLSIPEHVALAKEKYNVTLSRPRFVLVVGNYENVDAEKITDARRRFPDLELIDYDSLLQLYLMHEDALPTQISSQWD